MPWSASQFRDGSPKVIVSEIIVLKGRADSHIARIIDMTMILAASVISFWKILFDKNIILMHDLIFPTDLNQYLQLSLHSWNPLVNLGQPTLQPDATFPLALACYLLSRVGLTPGEIERFLLVGVIFLAGLSMYLLSMQLSAEKRFIGLVSAFVYMFNPFVMDNLLWGQVFLVNLAYSLIPLVLLCFVIAMDRHSISFAGLTGVLLALISDFDIQTAYIGAMILVLWTLGTIYHAAITRSGLRNVLQGSIVLLLVTIAVTAASRLYLVLSVLFGRLIIGIGGPIEAVSFWREAIVYVSENIGGLINTMRLTRVYSFYRILEYQALGTWFGEVIFGATFLSVSCVLAAILLPAHRRCRSTSWFLMVVLLFAYLAAGTLAPGGIYLFLYQNVVGFFIFREPTKFSVGVALGFSYLVAVTLSAIYRFLSEHRISFKRTMFPVMSVRMVAAVGLVLLVLLPNIMIFAQGDWGGLRSANFPPGYDDVYGWLKSRPGDFRVLILPLSGMGDWSDTGNTLPLYGPTGYADIAFLNSPPKSIIVQPSAISLTEGSRRILYYLENLLYSGQTDQLASLLSILGVKYIVVGPFYRPSPYDTYVETPLRTMEVMHETTGLMLKYSSGEFEIFENLQFKGITYMTSAPYLAFGDLNLLRLLAMSEADGELPTVIFGYSLTSEDLRSAVALSKGIVLQDDRFIDYVMQSLEDRYSTVMASYVSQLEEDSTNYWVLGTVYPRPVSDVYASGEFYSSPSFVYTTGTHVFLVAQYQSLADEEQQIWVRAVQGPDAGWLQITAGSHEFPAVSLHSQVFQGFKWIFVGSTKLGLGSQKLTIENLDGTNLVDRLITVPARIFSAAYANCSNSLEDKTLALVIDPSSFNPIAEYGLVINQMSQHQNDAIVIPEDDSFAATASIPLSSTFEFYADVQALTVNSVLSVEVDGQRLNASICSAEGTTGAIKIGSLHLSAGLHRISVKAESGNLELFALKLVMSPNEPSSDRFVVLEPRFDSFTHATILTSASLPFLVYSATYDQDWSLQTTIGHGKLHVETNGYANGWFIAEAESSNKEQVLNLSFSLQMPFSVALFTSNIIAFTIVIMSLFAIARNTPTAARRRKT